MDRIISDEERIRRAEDILERRRNTDLRISSESFSSEKSNNKLRKMLIQILICLIIYCFFYYIKNSNNENYKIITQNVSTTLNQDTDFKGLYAFICSKFKDIESLINKNQDNNENEENKSDSNNSQNGENSEINNGESKENDANSTGNDNENDAVNNSGKSNESDVVNNSENNENNVSGENISDANNMGIGGEIEEDSSQIASIDENQMETDVQYIISKIKLINPLKNGVVTSGYGPRNPTSIVSANHKGIDLGAVSGSTIIASSDGVVIKASSDGDFGKHIKIQNDDIVMTYAHCSKLLVKEGDYVMQGQKIAEVGATGKATGPHLHFEIRRADRAVNPEMLLEF